MLDSFENLIGDLDINHSTLSQLLRLLEKNIIFLKKPNLNSEKLNKIDIYDSDEDIIKKLLINSLKDNTQARDQFLNDIDNDLKTNIEHERYRYLK